MVRNNGGRKMIQIHTKMAEYDAIKIHTKTAISCSKHVKRGGGYKFRAMLKSEE